MKPLLTTQRLGLALVLLVAGAGCRGSLDGSMPSGAAPLPNVDLPASAAVASDLLRSNDRVMSKSPVGSSNTITADMPVPRPKTKPCVVQLFSNLAFKNFTNPTFNFTPPAGCPGPWAKVVLNFNVNVSKGIQYDRTGIIWLDGAVIFFGTTAEPSPNLGPSWHNERDVTELSALFKTANQGQIALGNVVGQYGLTGIIYGSAFLQFYPTSAHYPAPRVPDMVIGMPYSPPLGNVAQLPSKTSSTMEISTALPHNIVAADLELYLQSQNAEEQWFMCAPNSVWKQSDNELGFCYNSAFREGYVTVDGTPAGIAPVYPWIYTGGIDPYLWFPLPGVQTLQFEPYNVNLTPFAGYLDGATNPTIAVSVKNAYSYFSGAGDLLLYLDPTQSTVTGAVTSNTLKAPTFGTQQKVTYGSGTGLFGKGRTAAGTAMVRSGTAFTIDGYVNSSAGKVETVVRQNMQFMNGEGFSYISTAYVQNMYQMMTLKKTVKTIGRTTETANIFLQYPIEVLYTVAKTKAGGYNIPVYVFQGYQKRVNETSTAPFSKPFSSVNYNTVQSADTLELNSKYYLTGSTGASSSQLYTFFDSNDTCYGRQLNSKNNVVTADKSPSCRTPGPMPRPFP